MFVGGQVENPGIVKVNRLGGLIDAIDMAGGTKILKGGIKFTRISLDGSYDKRKIRFNRKSKLGSYSNPYLQDGDIIFVGKSGFKLTADVVSEVTNPFQGLFSAYGLYKAITD